MGTFVLLLLHDCETRLPRLRVLTAVFDPHAGVGAKSFADQMRDGVVSRQEIGLNNQPGKTVRASA